MKIYKESKETKTGKKEAFLALREDEDGDPCLMAVDENGKRIADLIFFGSGDPNGTVTASRANREMESLGYELPGAQFTDLGELIIE